MSRQDHFISKVRLSEEARLNLDRLIERIQSALTNSELSPLQPYLLQFGSLASSVATNESDIDVVLKFRSIESIDLLDYETAVMVFEVLRARAAVGIED